MQVASRMHRGFGMLYQMQEDARTAHSKAEMYKKQGPD
jgi:hypothetical protein